MINLGGVTRTICIIHHAAFVYSIQGLGNAGGSGSGSGDDGGCIFVVVVCGCVCVGFEWAESIKAR